MQRMQEYEDLNYQNWNKIKYDKVKIRYYMHLIRGNESSLSNYMAQKKRKIHKYSFLSFLRILPILKAKNSRISLHLHQILDHR